MKSKQQTPSRLHITLGALLFFSAPAFAAIAVPSWEGDLDTTSTLYTFTTDSRTPSPEEETNPFGSATALIEDESVESGGFGSGWQDPEGGITQSVRDAGTSGAWDLGSDGMGNTGRMTFTLPIGNPLGLGTRDLDIHVAFVWQEVLSPQAEPDYFIVEGLPTSETISHQVVEATGAFGHWQGTVWEATFENFTGNQITLVFDGSNPISVIEEVSIQTRITTNPIPEPGAPVILLMSFASLIAMRNRRANL